MDNPREPIQPEQPAIPLESEEYAAARQDLLEDIALQRYLVALFSDELDTKEPEKPDSVTEQ